MSNNENNETKKTPRNRTTDAKQSPNSVGHLSNNLETPVQSHYNCKKFSQGCFSFT